MIRPNRRRNSFRWILLAPSSRRKNRRIRTKVRKKYGLKELGQLRGGELGSERKKGKFVLKEVWDKQNIKERGIKCRRSKHQVRDCKVVSTAKIPPFLGNINQNAVSRKGKYNKEQHKMIELGSEADLGYK